MILFRQSPTRPRGTDGKIAGVRVHVQRKPVLRVRLATGTVAGESIFPSVAHFHSLEGRYGCEPFTSSYAIESASQRRLTRGYPEARYWARS
jgi:hypothetical protein